MKKKIFIIIIIILILAIAIFLVYNNRTKETQNNITDENTIENSQQEEIEENVTNTNIQSTTSNSIENTNNDSANTTQYTNSNEKTLIEQVSPMGFMGSSTYRVSLYSNGEVYVEKYDGNGYEKNNMISEDLVAQNVDSIEVVTNEEQETYGEVIIKSKANKGELLNKDFGWIEMQK